MAKELGEGVLFTGGAELTPEVTVVPFHSPGSLNHGRKTLMIAQGKNAVTLSPETMESILEWYNEE